MGHLWAGKGKWRFGLIRAWPVIRASRRLWRYWGFMVHTLPEHNYVAVEMDCMRWNWRENIDRRTMETMSWATFMSTIAIVLVIYKSPWIALEYQKPVNRL
jgi:hypothetical protein